MFPTKDARRWEDISRQQGVMARARALLAQAEERLRRSRAVLNGSAKEEPGESEENGRAAEPAAHADP